MAKALKIEINNFLTKCTDFKKCRFIVAPTKIKELLKSIATSKELYTLFSECLKGFDYTIAKRNCFVTESDGYGTKNKLVLPNTIAPRLAMTFCLLVDIDKGRLDFNSFLSTYFYVDGSYYASYQLFCDNVIMVMADIVAELYKDVLSQPDEALEEQNPTSKILKDADICIDAVKYFLTTIGIPLDDVSSAHIMLEEIRRAMHGKDFNTLSALLCGMNYYIMYYNCMCDEFMYLINLIDNLKAVSPDGR